MQECLKWNTDGLHLLRRAGLPHGRRARSSLGRRAPARRVGGAGSCCCLKVQRPAAQDASVGEDLSGCQAQLVSLVAHSNLWRRKYPSAHWQAPVL